jgi:deoxyadenosine/deoxycytidine kinase
VIRYKHIAIEGNIGAGKTTLAKMLSRYLGSSLLLEEFEDNHFLKAFYNGKDFAIHAEIQFILDRSKQLADFFSKKHQLIISDYVPEKSLIFSKMNLSESEYKIIKDLTSVLYKNFQKPDLILFIDRSTEDLIENIIKRGRVYEQNIDGRYIENLNNGYEDWLGEINCPVLRINANEIDISHPEKLAESFKKLFQQEYSNDQRIIQGIVN